MAGLNKNRILHTKVEVYQLNERHTNEMPFT